MTDKPAFTMSANARLLLAELRKAKVGDTIPYSVLWAASSGEDRGALYTAMRRMLKDENMVFSCIPTVGYKRLNDSEIVASGSDDVSRIRRLSNRSVERQLKADFDGLTPVEKSRFTAQVSVLASVAMMTKPKSLDKVADAAPKDVRELPINQTLRMFTSEAA